MSEIAESNVSAASRHQTRPANPDLTSGELLSGRSERAGALFEEALERVRQRTDRMFATLMVFQWLAGIGCALWLSPRTWVGAASSIHVHVWAAVFLGGAVTSLPVALAALRPGAALTRHTIAISQMLMSGLLIHLTGGRIETHFHVFGSLAFLAFYRDWRVIVSATLVTAADHLLRGLFWPSSIFGVINVDSWRWLEHSGWVIFEDVFLLIAIHHGLRDGALDAMRTAELEALKSNFECQVAERTADLTAEIAERVEAENRLRLRDCALNAAANAICIVDRPGSVIWINPAFTKLTGYSEGEVIGQNPRMLKSERHESEFYETMWKTVLAGEIWRGELMNRRKDGGLYPEEMTITPICDAHGEITHFIAIKQDISERKQAEAAMLEMHKRLLDASLEAGRAEIAINVLHNIGNVLNSVNVSANLLSEQTRKTPVKQLRRLVTLLFEQGDNLGAFFSADQRGRTLPVFLDQMAERLSRLRDDQATEVAALQKNIDHIKGIVLAQQRHAKVSGLNETLDVIELVEDALRLSGHGTERNSAQVVRDFAPSLPAITTEKHKVFQILVNLLRNANAACDDSSNAGKQVTVRARREDGQVLIQVVDNGVGIPGENLDRIFNHGFTTKNDGHGFGLHSCANAAKEIGGWISVQSDGPGQGATFTLGLPVERRVALVGKPRCQSADRPSVPANS